MEKELLQKYLKEGYSFNQISKLTGRSLTSVRYWKDKYSLKSSYKTFRDQEKVEYGETRFCSRCQSDVKTENFHQRRGKAHGSTYCKNCTTDQTLERMRKLKSQMVDYKGGCCQRCGYNKYQGALEFHHLDPGEKDFNPSTLRKYKFDERMKSELDKCVLVCANCHREIHHELKEKKREIQ